MGSNFQALIRPVPDRLQERVEMAIAAPGGRQQPKAITSKVAFSIPYDQLSIYARSYESSAPLAHLPIYAIAEMGTLPSPKVTERDPHDGHRGNAGPQADVPSEPLVHYPLGLIGTDHTGYASFDLTVLRSEETILAFQRSQKQLGQAPKDGSAPQTIGLRHLWVFPFADPILMVDALQSGDIGPQVIALRIELDESQLAGRELDRPMVSMQNPNILDWRLSPGSFTLSGAVLVGEDGCETLLPSNLSTQQFRFRQVARCTGSALPMQPDARRTESAHTSIGRERLRERPRTFGAGYVFEYTTEWFPVGHSLGQVIYSLPLAPGEVVQFAIVDWARADDAARQEETGLSESLVHDQLRDRTLTESVQAVLDEWQRGGSVMTGTAASAGAGLTSRGMAGAGVGLTAALGGAYSTSSGTRELTAQTTQHIADAFHQASTAIRELRSTVVVHSKQSEKSDVQTRVVANYNHCHALTLLYYEVLRHYRVVTRLAQVRPVLLVDYGEEFTRFPDADSILPYRAILEDTLLDARLSKCFDAIERLSSLSKEPASPHPIPGDTAFVFFDFSFDVGGMSDEHAELRINLRGKDLKQFKTIHSPLRENAQSDRIDIVGSFKDQNKTYSLPGVPYDVQTESTSVQWKDIFAIDFDFNPQGGADVGLGLKGVRANGITADGQQIPILDWKGDFAFKTPTHFVRPIIEPSGPPPPVDPMMKLTEEERVCANRLLMHLQKNAFYYNRALWLNEDPNARATRFGGSAFSIKGKALLDLIENRALEVLGNYVAFPVNAYITFPPDDQVEQAIQALFGTDVESAPQGEDAFIEQLLTLPSRGVFGEAKLGHCDACELKDAHRFWDWQKSPIQFAPANITGADAGSRAHDPTGLTPTPFPQGIVNIVTPGSLPDPTGLGDALKVLGTPGIFRDQSGLQQVGTLLGKLSDNATSLAAQAMQGQARKELMDTIRNSDKLTPAQKSDLMGQLITGQAHQQTQPTPSTGGSAQGASGGTPAGGVAPGTTGGGTSVSDTSAGSASGGGKSQQASPKTAAPPPTPRSEKPQRSMTVPAQGLTFVLKFDNVEGTIVTGSGFAYITAGNGATGEFPNFKITNGQARLNAPNIGSAGTIAIKVDYDLNSLYDVAADAFSKAGTNMPVKRMILPLQGSGSYKLPTDGSNIVMLTVKPRVDPKTVTASSSMAAADQVAGTLGLNGSVVSVNATGSTGTTKTTGETTQWIVNTVTGGLDIEQFPPSSKP